MSSNEKIDIQSNFHLSDTEWASIAGTKFHLQMIRNRAVYTTAMFCNGEDVYPSKWTPKPTFPDAITNWLLAKTEGLYYIYDNSVVDDEFLVYFELKSDLRAFTEAWHGRVVDREA